MDNSRQANGLAYIEKAADIMQILPVTLNGPDSILLGQID